MDKIITIQNLSKNYGSIRALDGLNLEVQKGDVLGILGPNGSGKTTTLGIILGILQADSGNFVWFNDAYGKHHRRKIGSILETPNFYPYLNADDNLSIVAQIKNIENPRIDEALETVDLLSRRKSKFSTYSLGMKQRLAIAGAILGDPEVLLFDEPTNGLDPNGIADVRNILKRLAEQGNTIIMASHILDEVEKICNKVAILKKGKLLSCNPIGSQSKSNIMFEISAIDMDKLNKTLSSNHHIKITESTLTMIKGHFVMETSTQDFSRYLYDSGNIITHFNIRKQNLEEDYLKITSNKA